MGDDSDRMHFLLAGLNSGSEIFPSTGDRTSSSGTIASRNSRTSDETIAQDHAAAAFPRHWSLRDDRALEQQRSASDTHATLSQLLTSLNIYPEKRDRGSTVSSAAVLYRTDQPLRFEAPAEASQLTFGGGPVRSPLQASVTLQDRSTSLGPSPEPLAASASDLLAAAAPARGEFLRSLHNTVETRERQQSAWASFESDLPVDPMTQDRSKSWGPDGSRSQPLESLALGRFATTDVFPSRSNGAQPQERHASAWATFESDLPTADVDVMAQDRPKSWGPDGSRTSPLDATALGRFATAGVFPSHSNAALNGEKRTSAWATFDTAAVADASSQVSSNLADAVSRDRASGARKAGTLTRSDDPLSAAPVPSSWPLMTGPSQQPEGILGYHISDGPARFQQYEVGQPLLDSQPLYIVAPPVPNLYYYPMGPYYHLSHMAPPPQPWDAPQAGQEYSFPDGDPPPWVREVHHIYHGAPPPGASTFMPPHAHQQASQSAGYTSPPNGSPIYHPGRHGYLSHHRGPPTALQSQGPASRGGGQANAPAAPPDPYPPHGFFAHPMHAGGAPGGYSTAGSHGGARGYNHHAPHHAPPHSAHPPPVVRGGFPYAEHRQQDVSASVAAFQSMQWALLRALAVHRYALCTGTEPPPLTTAAVRCALDAFRVPALVSELVSRPERRSGPPHARAGQSSGDPLSSSLDVAVVERQPHASEADVVALLSTTAPQNTLVWVPVKPLQNAPEWFPPAGAEGSLLLGTSGGGGAAQQSASSERTGSSTDAGAPLVSAAGPAVDPALLQRIAAAAMGAIVADLIARRRWKTKPCHAWARSGGVCPRGSTCDFAHGDAELRVYSVPRDSRWKTRMCRVYLDSAGASCTHGDRCSFAHGVTDLRIHLPSVSKTAAGAAAPKAPQPGAVGGASRFRSQLCIAWLKGTATAYAQRALSDVCMSSLEWGGPGEDAEGRHSVASPADLCGVGCASGDDCPFAHGLADLRLPSATEQEQALQMLLSEPLHAGLGSDEIGDEGGLSFRLQMLLLVACGMLVPSSSDALIRHLDAAVDGGALGPLPCVGVLPEFERLPVPVARALSVAVANPMLQVVLSYYDGAEFGGAGSGGGGFARSGAGKTQHGGSSNATLTKIVSVVGNDAADASLLTGAVALGLAHASVELPSTPVHAALPPAMPSSALTGRYGAMIRRRNELRAVISATQTSSASK